MLETENPYQSPRFAAPRPLTENRPWVDAVRVQRVEKRFLYRRVVLEAPVDLDLEYCGYHALDTASTIRIDGQLVARRTNVWSFVPRFDLELVTGGRTVPLVVEVRTGGLTVRAFRVTIAGEAVYTEGRM
jgi:hypothetical protein